MWNPREAMQFRRLCGSSIGSVLRGRARRYLDSGCQPADANTDGRFCKSTTGGKKAPANTTDYVGGRRRTGNAQDWGSKREWRLQPSSEIHKTDFGCASREVVMSDQNENKSIADPSRRSFLGVGSTSLATAE